MTYPQLKYTKMGHRQIYNGDGFRDITMLSYWGSVIIEANTTGFAMEFIGDMNDSVAMFNSAHLGVTGSDTECVDALTTKNHGVVGDAKLAHGNCGNLGANRSKYEVMSTGVNLQ